MKKTISLFVAIVMIFTLSFSAFATTETTTLPVIEKPTGTPADGAELGMYYANKLNAGYSPADVAQEWFDDIESGVFPSEESEMVNVVFTMYQNVDDAAVMDAFMEAYVEIAEANGYEVPDVLKDLIGVSTTTETTTDADDITLPDDGNGDTTDSDFLNSILGILGTIGDMIFGGGSGDGDETTTDPVFPDETTTGPSSGNNVPQTGDTTLASITAVALVAGAAFALTRKKSDDAE